MVGDRMKKALIKDSIKEIKNTYKRFISILLMAFLGVGFFAGLRATSPDMVDTIDKYYDDQNVYDIQILSTLGLTQEDIEELSKIENIETVQGSYEIDGKIEIGSSEKIAKVITLQELNKPILLEGNFPQSENECLVEPTFLSANNMQIGDTIKLEIENTTNDEGEEIKYLKQENLTIVGTIQSPLYISRDRGTSNLGAGKINYYIYISPDNINAKEVYTSIYIKPKDIQKYVTSSEKYEDYIEKIENSIEEIKEEREQARHNQLVEKAQEKVNDAEKELNEQKEDAEKQIYDAEKEIENGKKKIQDAENEINSQKKKADTEFANAQKEITNAKTQISNNETELEAKENEANQKFAELEKQKTAYQSQLSNPLISEQEKQVLQAAIAQIDAGISSGKQEIETARAQITSAKAELQAKENQLNTTKASTYAKIENARKELERSRQEIEDGERELSEKRQEFNDKIAEAENKLADAKEKISEIENPTWYILDRNSNAGYVGFIQDTESIENIGKVFPIIFFAVATLISLTSMTRMVEEQRMQLGTLKALGYNEIQITMKYVLYASLACIIGGILGMSVGFILLPKIIWMMYGLMYQMTDISITFNLKYGGIGLALICICILGATIYTVFKELKNEPAKLMRPKAPKIGNRVILERIPFIWKRLNFSQKVTIRNLLRYKKRFYMTVIGILGCTALILTGFGIKDSVSRIIPNQFENIFQYDMEITLKDSIQEDDKEALINQLSEREEIEKIAKAYMISGDAINGDKSESIQIIIPEVEKDLEGLININDIKTKERIELTENQICLTDKAAQLLGVKAGDIITIKDNDDREVEIQISNVVENYVQHYIFMSKQTYENLYKENYKINVILLKNTELSEKEQDNLASEIMNKSEVAAVSNITSFAQTIEDTMSLLNYVVVILIVSAGLLAFVVLYNLANVNISERIRELATIKVLGFYDNEVYNYVTKETIILTAIGIALGLIGGYFLNYYIMGTCEINILRFNKEINFISYVYAAAITIIFTIIVNIATYFSLKKINMIESLKSVE